MNTIIDIANNVITSRELNQEEKQQQQFDDANDAKLRDEINQSISIRTTLFAKLGITEEEARLLLGGN